MAQSLGSSGSLLHMGTPGGFGACLAQQNSGFKEAQKSINGRM